MGDTLSHQLRLTVTGRLLRMGVIQFSVRAVGAVIFVLAVVAPIAVQLICQLDAAKWAVPANSVVGKTVIVTGANSGLGFETARVLAQEGAQVVMACRSPDKCKVAIDQIQQANPKANLKALLLDLSDPNSVRNFAAEFLASHQKLDLLINNAAIMATEYATVQWPGGAVESQFATNHLGPYLLTGLLQNVLESTPGSRVINHSSSASDMTARVKDVHKIAQIAVGEYDAFGDQYTSSKRANRYFTWSLNQKLSRVLSVACHPGWTGTNLQHRATGVKASFMSNSVWEGLVATRMRPMHSRPASAHSHS